MQAIWSGVLHFDEMQMAIELYPASNKSRNLLQPMHRGCLAALQSSVVCPKHGTVGKDARVMGYALPDGDFILLESEDFDSIRSKVPRIFNLNHFIPKSQLNPSDFMRSYFIVPGGNDQQQYATLREALRHAGLYGLGRLHLHNHARLAAMWVKEKTIMLSTLLHDHELQAAPELRPKPASAPTPAEIQACRDRMFEHCAPLTPGLREDPLREALIDLLGRKIVRTVSDDELGFIEQPEPSRRYTAGMAT